MGRPRRPLNAVNDLKSVQVQLKSKDTAQPWQRQRLRALLLGLEGRLTAEEIAASIGVSERTIGEWFILFRRGGIARLLIKKPKGNGPASWLDPHLFAFRIEIAKGQWRKAADAKPWLERQLKRPLSLVAVYKYLQKYTMRRRGVVAWKRGVATCRS